jgi:hypothetical protein
LSTERHFVFNEVSSYWNIKRRNYWLLSSLRFMPTGGLIRPQVGALVGPWIHDVFFEPSQEEAWETSGQESLGTDVNWAYGALAGLSIKYKKAYVGLVIQYLKGGGIGVPDHKDVSVIDGILHYSTVRTGPVHQWTIRLEASGGL